MTIEQFDKLIASVIGLVLLVVIVLATPFYIVPAGHRGVMTNWGAVDNSVKSEGLGFKIPFMQKLIPISVQTQVIDTEKSPLSCATKDLQDVNIGVVINYKLKPEVVNKIYQQYNTSFQSSVLEPMVREIVKSQSANYTAEELITKRAEFSEKISTILNEKFSEKDAIFERLNITDLQFSQSFNQAIESKVTAEQSALTAKNKLEQIKFEAEQRTTQAKAEAEAIKIQAEAITSQGGKEYVNLKWVEKWNGQTPSTILGDKTNAFINLGN